MHWAPLRRPQAEVQIGAGEILGFERLLTGSGLQSRTSGPVDAPWDGR